MAFIVVLWFFVFIITTHLTVFALSASSSSTENKWIIKLSYNTSKVGFPAIDIIDEMCSTLIYLHTIPTPFNKAVGRRLYILSSVLLNVIRQFYWWSRQSKTCSSIRLYWLHVLPISSSCLRQHNEAICISVCLILGVTLYVPRTCLCGAYNVGQSRLIVQTKSNRLTPALSSQRPVCRALSRANIQSVNQQTGHIDLMVKYQVVWHVALETGKFAVWEVTVANAVVASSYSALDG